MALLVRRRRGASLPPRAGLVRRLQCPPPSLPFLLLYFLLINGTVYGKRTFPGLARLEEEKGRDVSVGEYLAYQYVKNQQRAARERAAAGGGILPKDQRPRPLGRRLPKPPATAATSNPTSTPQATAIPTESAASTTSSSTSETLLSKANDLHPSTLSSSESTASDRATDALLLPLRELPILAQHHARAIYDRLIITALYRPPVGLVSLFLIVRFVRTLADLWTATSTSTTTTVSESATTTTSGPPPTQQRRMMRRQYTSRAWNLDTLDGHYAASGGVQSVRQRLCVAALSTTLVDDDGKASSGADPYNATTALLLEALRVSAHPAEPRLDFLYKLAGPLSRLLPPPDATPTASSGRGPSPSTTAPQQLQQSQSQRMAALRSAHWTCHARIVDALLRLLRQRLLQTCVRLARTEAHWRRRVQAWERTGGAGAGWLLEWTMRGQPWAKRRLEEDRLQWACAEAALRAEVERLGRVAHVLLQQPPDLDPTELLPAAKASELATAAAAGDSNSTASGRRYDLWSRYSVRWVADGRGHLSVRRLDAPASSTLPSGRAVWRTLENDVDATRSMEVWVQQARQVICQVLDESVATSVDRNETDLQSLDRQWCLDPTRPSGNLEDSEHAWKVVIHHCDNLASWRRVGEGRTVRLLDTALVGWTRRLDFLGIPSSLLYFRLATLAHSKVEPFLPSLRSDAIKGLRKILEILQQRVWVPFQGIVMDIMNQGKGMMSAFSLDDEQVSLDRMLRDLGLGDGSPEQRKLGLQLATEQYENILQQSLFSNFVRGKLVRLLLIQVQQLKVGLLSALDTIDVLMAGNRVHFYLLATVPALAIAYYSTRFLFRFWYNVRAKDLRPVTFAHADMGEFLDGIESILLSSDTTTNRGRNAAPLDHQSLLLPPRVRLDAAELGRVVLYLHRYLLLLEFGSPPFPSSECEQIHERLRKLLHHPGLRLSLNNGGDASDARVQDQRLVAWFATVQRKHSGLLSSL